MQGLKVIQVGEDLILCIESLTPVTSWAEVAKIDLTQKMLQDMKDDPNSAHWAEVSKHFQKRMTNDEIMLAARAGGKPALLAQQQVLNQIVYGN